MKGYRTQRRYRSSTPVAGGTPGRCARKPVRVLVLLPEEDEVGALWSSGIAKEWAAELTDPRQDIYTLEDGQPVDAAG